MTSMQGTYEFMSRRLVSTLRTANPYLHSPVDDLESFYYTAQWAVAFNDVAGGKRHDGIKIQRFREIIGGSERELANVMVRDDLRPIRSEAQYGPFFAQSLHLLAPWRFKLSELGSDWYDVLDNAASRDGEDKERFLGLNFLIYGYRGVTEYLQLVHEHRASLQRAV